MHNDCLYYREHESSTDLIKDFEGVPVYIVLGHVVVILRVLYKSDLVTHFFVKEEAQ
jgi:hypothetical protein